MVSPFGRRRVSSALMPGGYPVYVWYFFEFEIPSGAKITDPSIVFGSEKRSQNSDSFRFDRALGNGSLEQHCGSGLYVLGGTVGDLTNIEFFRKESRIPVARGWEEALGVCSNND